MLAHAMPPGQTKIPSIHFFFNYGAAFWPIVRVHDGQLVGYLHPEADLCEFSALRSHFIVGVKAPP
ncbi:MAG: hypothetical protein V4631_08745, partial [Pseudomonadota bacterium]